MHRGIFHLVVFFVLLLPVITVGCVSFPASTTAPPATTTTVPETTTTTTTTTTMQAPVIQAWLNPTGIMPKGTAELHWNVTGANSVSIDQGIGPVAPSGNRAVSPNVTTTYTVTAYYAGGTVTNAVTLAVSPLGPVPSPSPQPVYEKDWLGSTYTHEYHYPGCPVARHIPQHSRIWFDTTMQAQAAGYHPCPVCKPPR